MKLQASILLAGSVVVLSGCGIRGDLERPPPLWGPDERTESEREHEGDTTPAETEESEGGGGIDGGGQS